MIVRVEYLVLISAIQKNWKNEYTNLIKQFFKLSDTSNLKRETKWSKLCKLSILSIQLTSKRFYINKVYVMKDLTTHYID